ncbi:MAG: shikimate dehydrogenase [Armatimonadetes bacterium]|nr:shikimate dehydrogenase [Armatimonadota bacterium]
MGLIGWPVEHSLSPPMHNAAFGAVGLDWHYVPLPVRLAEVVAAVRGLAALGLRGANVTVPHKQAVLPVLDFVHPDARAMGAANTLVVKRDPGESPKICGYNTDVAGFLRALRQGGFEAEHANRITVIGAGGAARAVVFGLLRESSASIEIINRTLNSAVALVQNLAQDSRDADRLRAVALTDDTLIESAQRADLLVNATSVGLWPKGDESPWPNTVRVPKHLTVFDLVYNPIETILLQQARESGAMTIDGLGMLIEQGALAFELWTGCEAPVHVMRTACENTLGQRVSLRHTTNQHDTDLIKIDSTNQSDTCPTSSRRGNAEISDCR